MLQSCTIHMMDNGSTRLFTKYIKIKFTNSTHISKWSLRSSMHTWYINSSSRLMLQWPEQRTLHQRFKITYNYILSEQSKLIWIIVKILVLGLLAYGNTRNSRILILSPYNQLVFCYKSIGPQIAYSNIWFLPIVHW